MDSKIYDELNKSNDFFIHNRVINNPYKDHSYNEVAKRIYDERDLGSEKKQELIKSFPMYLKEVTRMLENGSKKSEIVQHLISVHIPKNQAISIVNDKFNLYKNSLEASRKSKTPWILIIVFSFILLRWILRIVS